MPVLAPVNAGRLQAFSGSTAGVPNGLASTFFYQTFGRGIPRRENLLAIRLLEATHAVQIPMQAIKSQVAATPWMIRVPEGITATGRHEAAAAELEQWLDGNFNDNRESFTSLIKAWLGDVLAIDSGVLELVPGEGGTLEEMYVRDGITFTKNPDKHGRLPPTGSKDAAYWQFSLTSNYGFLEHANAVTDLLRENVNMSGLMRPFNPIGFSRDQLVWTEENPRSWDVYGLGRLTILKHVLEILLNQDISNKKFFTSNEIPEGLLNLVEANENEIQRFREYWNREIKGREHKLPIVGSKQATYIPFRPSLVDLQFLDSQRWYHKLVWFVFGVSGPEVGETEDVNMANGQEQAVSVWRRTTKPILELLAAELNRKVLPYHKAYHDVGGELEFAWDFDNPAIQALRRTRENEDLDKGTLTINEVRKSRGQEPLPWGDMFPEATKEIVRRFPTWAMEEWFGIEDAPEESDDFGSGVFGLGAPPGDGPDLPPMDFASLNTERVKEALRNEPSGRFPAVAGLVDQTSKEFAAIFRRLEDDVTAAVKANFPRKAVSFDVAAIVASIDISDQLSRVARNAGLAAMKTSADYHARNAEEALNAATPPDAPELVFDVNVAETFAARNMAQRSAIRMRGVNETVKRIIRDTLVEVVATGGGNVTDATAAIRTLFADRITDSHARLVARTEVLMASRSGAQALAESSDLIAGKKWVATHDNRTRPWHLAMDGVIVPKDRPFTVPVVDARQRNRGYPKSTFIVGDDEPYNCRCDQVPVLVEDMPADLKAYGRMKGIRRRHSPVFADNLTDTQRDVLFVHGHEGEAFGACLRRIDQAAGNRKALAKSLGVSRATLYEWLGEAAPDTES